jgi:hypothetical protein
LQVVDLVDVEFEIEIVVINVFGTFLWTLLGYGFQKRHLCLKKQDYQLIDCLKIQYCLIKIVCRMFQGKERDYELHMLVHTNIFWLIMSCKFL